MEYMTAQEAAKQWGISQRRVQLLCVEGRIKGASKFGRQWSIPKNIKQPADHRFRKYRNQKSVVE